jgi:hypothetical protein
MHPGWIEIRGADHCPRRECGLGGTIEMKELKPTLAVQALAGAAFGLVLLTCCCSSPGGKEKDTKSVLTPLDIVQAIQTAPPGPPRADISMQYFGLLVECEGSIVGITKLAGKEVQVHIAVRSPSGEFPETVSVFFSINLDNYPGVELLKAGDSIMITGEFQKVELRGVILRPRIVSYNKSHR